ncbi:MAG: lysophospholipase [Firmicutes bacterium]|nr:lysophospholipase [Bacillota bacterium]
MIEEIVFTNKKGYKLVGNLYSPLKPGPFPVVVFAHSFFDRGKHSTRSVPIAEKLVDEKIASFLFDFTGYGESEGTRKESTIFQQFDDLKQAVNALRLEEDITLEKIGLHGVSTGCLSCLYYSLERKVSAMVLRSARTNGFFPNLYKHAPEIKTPTLFIHGSRDKLIPYTERFIKAMTAPAKLEIIEGADHRFLDIVLFEQALILTVDWFKKHL